MGRYKGGIKPLKDRLLTKLTVNKTTGCWEYLSNKGTTTGHVRIWNYELGKAEYAHRAAYRLLGKRKRKIPDGKKVLHHCDNPPCCNPDHLYAGTEKQNMADMYARGRGRKELGEARHSSKLTVDAVVQIRASMKSSRELGREYGVSHGTILNVRNYTKWKHVA